MPTFDTRDPDGPDFWDERFVRDFTPWDQGGVPLALRRFVDARRPMTVFIPGCGTGHEVAYLADAGWDVTAIDFAPAAVAAAKQVLGRHAGRVRLADFFTFEPERPPECIYERAFLCALPRSRSADIVARYAQLLPAGGLLAGFFFFDDNPKGPPFGIQPEALYALLAPYFERIDDAMVEDSIPVFAGKERWQVWQRR